MFLLDLKGAFLLKVCLERKKLYVRSNQVNLDFNEVFVMAIDGLSNGSSALSEGVFESAEASPRGGGSLTSSLLDYPSRMTSPRLSLEGDFVGSDEECSNPSSQVSNPSSQVTVVAQRVLPTGESPLTGSLSHQGSSVEGLQQQTGEQSSATNSVASRFFETQNLVQEIVKEQEIQRSLEFEMLRQQTGSLFDKLQKKKDKLANREQELLTTKEELTHSESREQELQRQLSCVEQRIQNMQLRSELAQQKVELANSAKTAELQRKLAVSTIESEKKEEEIARLREENAALKKKTAIAEALGLA